MSGKFCALQLLKRRPVNPVTGGLRSLGNRQVYAFLYHPNALDLHRSRRNWLCIGIPLKKGGKIGPNIGNQ
jgi:hypothetical protein